jgi:hypothetical protein
MEASTARKQVGRSPRYPGIDLERAVARARVLWEAEAHYPANVQIIMQHWGYKPKSGGGAVTIAALKSFGLIETSGTGDTRTAKLTRLAEDILHAEDPMVQLEAAKAAALLPTIHKELWDRYGPQLPSEQSLDSYLRHERGFTPVGARELIGEYKRTISFAGLTERGATLPSRVSDSSPEPEPGIVPGAAAVAGTPSPSLTRARAGEGRESPPAQIMIPIPLPEGMGTLSIPRHVSGGSWDVVLAILNSYKPLLTTPEAEGAD